MSCEFFPLVPGREMILLDQRHAYPRIPQHQIARDARPVDPASDNEHVELLVSQPREIRVARPRSRMLSRCFRHRVFHQLAIFQQQFGRLRLEAQHEHRLRIRCPHQTPALAEIDPRAVDRDYVVVLLELAPARRSRSRTSFHPRSRA